VGYPIRQQSGQQSVSMVMIKFLLSYTHPQPMRRQTVFSAILAGAIVTCLPTIALAQSGVTIFSGVDRKQELSYRLDFDGDRGGWDRYRLRVSKDKMKLSVAQFIITYPDYYKGAFDTKAVEISVNGKPWKLQEANWDKDRQRLEVYPLEPIPANSQVELIFSNVRNPDNPGTFYFNCLIQAPGDVPIMRELGTWIISIN
jgi:Protein of unknown function (DUF2808)